MAFSQTAVTQSCLCPAMQNKLHDLKSRKQQKQYLYSEVLKKYGKNITAQKALLHTFQTPHSNLTIEEIEKKIKSSEKPQCTQLTRSDFNTHPLKQTIEKFLNEEETWAEIIKHDAEMHLIEELQKAKRLEDNKKKLKIVLDKQVEDRRQAILNEYKKNQKYEREQDEQWKAQQEKEKLLEQEIRSKTLQHRRVMNDYMVEVQQRKIAERKKSMQYEKDVVKNIRNEIIKEELARALKKEKDKEMYLSAIKENEERSKEKAIQARKEKLDDVVVLNDYIKMMDKQEKDKNDYSRNKETRIQNSLNQASWNALDEIRKNDLQESLQIHDYMKDNLIREYAKDEIEQNNRLEQAKELKNYYMLQMSEKMKKMKEEAFNDKKLMSEMIQDNLRHHKYEIEKGKADRELKAVHAQFLKSQMKDKKN